MMPVPWRPSVTSVTPSTPAAVSRAARLSRPWWDWAGARAVGSMAAYALLVAGVMFIGHGGFSLGVFAALVVYIACLRRLLTP